MTLVIRADELERLERVVHGDDVDTIAVIGSEGSGKSTLMSAASRSETTPAKMIRGNPGEISWPYSGLSLFLNAFDELHDTNLSAVLNEPDASVSAFVVASILNADLRRLKLGPSAILIDDVDNFDSQSQEVIGYLLRRNSAKNLRTIVSLADVPVDGPFSTVSTMLLADITPNVLFDLGKSLSTPLVRDDVLESIAAVSGGSPLAFKSIRNAMPNEVLNGNVPMQFPLQPGKKLARVVESSLAGLSEGEMRCLQVLSCAGCIPEDVFEQHPDTSVEALDDLISQGYVYRSYAELVIQDPRVRATIYRSMSDGQRTSLHGELAKLSSGIHRGQAAWHTSFVDHSVDVCADLLAEAGALIHRGLTQPAIEIAERVLVITHGDPPLKDFMQFLQPLVFECEFNLALRYLRTIRGNLHPQPVPPDVLRLRVLVDFMHSNIIDDQRVTEVVTAFRSTQPDSCARLLAVTGLCHLQRWEIDEAERYADFGEEVGGIDSPGPMALRAALNLYRAAFAGRELPNYDKLRSHIEEMSNGFGPEISWILAAQALSIGERYDDARTLLKNVLDQSAHLPSVWVIFARHIQFLNEYRAGDYHQVHVVYDLLMAAYQHRDSFGISRALMTALVATADGDSTTANDAVRNARRLVPHGTNPVVEAMIAVMHARLDMHDGKYDAANANFGRGRHLLLKVGSPHLLRFHDDFIESLMYTGDTVSARSVYDELVAAAHETPSKWAEKAIARSHAMILSGDDSLVAFSTLLQSWTGLEQEYLRARTYFAYSNRLKQLGFKRDSQEANALGQEIFREIGVATNGGGRVRNDSNDAATLADLLTDKELPVVRLLAKGHKNQMIARELFISVRTVELRLTNIYRKVGVKSRFELMGVIDGELDVE